MTKNRIFSLSMMMVLTATAVTGCAETKTKGLVNNGKEVIFTIGEGDSLQYFYAEDNWANIRNTKAGTQALYDVIFKAVVQTKIPLTDNLKSAVELKVDAFEKSLQDQIDAAGGTVSLSEARDLTLQQMGLANMDALREQYLYEIQLEKIQTRYYTDFREELASDYLENGLPFHVRHILVKLTDSDLYKGVISSTQANNLADVCLRLAQGKKPLNSFLELASSSLNEGGTNSTQGDLGIMDTYTSFVNEFKLGVYSFETFKQPVEDQAEFASKFALPDEFSAFYGDGFNTINVSACQLLKDNANKTIDLYPEIDRDKNGKADDDAQDYARNILYNNLFNFRGVQLLNFDLTKAEEITNANTLTVEYTQGGAKDIVVDSNNRPILVIRDSDNGVHFIVIEKSPFDEDAVTYFTKLEDTDEGYKTFVELNPDKNEDAIDARIKNFIAGGYSSSGSTAADNNLLLYRLFNEYYAQTQIQVTDNTLMPKIEQLIAASINYKEGQIADAKYTTWLTYLRLLQRADELADKKANVCAVTGTCG